jgi:opacity protein-like surface antigen
MKNTAKFFWLLITAIAALGSSLGFAQVTETNYNAQNFNTNAGYVRGSGIISTVQPSGLRWQGNDPYNTNTFTGETDLVARVAGYTPTPLANSSLIQGGLGVADSILPGTNNVQIWKTFTPSSTVFQAPPTVSFFVEWSLIPSLEGAPFNLNDTFSFDLRNAANTLSLLSLQLTPGIATQPNSYTLQTIASGVGTNSRVELAYQSLFQVQVDMTGSSYDMQLWQINSTNRAVITNVSLVTGGSLSAGMTALDFATIGVDWELASGNPAEPGSNYLIANQFEVTTTGTPIPEPGTWAAAALLVFAATYVVRRRKNGERASVAGA